MWGLKWQRRRWSDHLGTGDKEEEKWLKWDSGNKTTQITLLSKEKLVILNYLHLLLSWWGWMWLAHLINPVTENAVCYAGVGSAIGSEKTQDYEIKPDLENTLFCSMLCFLTRPSSHETHKHTTNTLTRGNPDLSHPANIYGFTCRCYVCSWNISWSHDHCTSCSKSAPLTHTYIESLRRS